MDFDFVDLGVLSVGEYLKKTCPSSFPSKISFVRGVVAIFRVGIFATVITTKIMTVAFFHSRAF